MRSKRKEMKIISDVVIFQVIEIFVDEKIDAIEMQYEENDDVVSLTVTNIPSIAPYNTIDSCIYRHDIFSSYRTFALCLYVFTSLTSLHPVPITFHGLLRICWALGYSHG